MLNVLINIVDCLVETVARRVIEKITGIKITIPFFSLPRKITSTILNTSIAIDRKDELRLSCKLNLLYKLNEITPIKKEKIHLAGPAILLVPIPTFNKINPAKKVRIIENKINLEVEFLNLRAINPNMAYV